MTSAPRPNPSSEDPLLDAFLEELLGQQTPPQLKGEILAKWQSRCQAPPVAGRSTQAAPPVSTSALTAHRRDHHRTGGKRRRRPSSAIAWSAVVITLVTSVALAVWLGPGMLAERSGQPSSVADGPRPEGREFVAQSNESVTDADDRFERDPRDAVNGGSTTQSDVSINELAVDAPSVDSSVRRDLASDDRGDALLEGEQMPSVPVPPEVATSDEIVAKIDGMLRDAWEIAKVTPAPPVDDEIWCRRVYEQWLGRSPTTDEMVAFAQLPALERRRTLLTQLANDPRTAREYADHLATVWTDAWLGPLEQTGRSVKPRRLGLERYLQRAIAENTSYDQVVRELLAAVGSSSPRDPNHNDATNFLLAFQDQKGQGAAEGVCRAFLGQRATCAACHADSREVVSQDQYQQLQRTFGDVRLELDTPGRLVLANDDVDQRQRLAREIATSRQAARAHVNRSWSQFFDYGFTSPTDDMGKHNPVAHGELLEYLTDQFIAHGYDHRQLMVWMALSAPFSHSHVVTSDGHQDAPEFGSVALFSRDYLVPARFPGTLEAIAAVVDGGGNLVEATSESGDGKSVSARQASGFRVDEDRGADAVPSADDPNAGYVLSPGQRRMVRHWHDLSLTVDEKLRHVFLSVLGRVPSDSELRHARQLYESHEQDPVVALERLCWALTNSAEY